MISRCPLLAPGVLAGAVGLLAWSAAPSQVRAGELPISSRLTGYIRTLVALTPHEETALRNGVPVTRLLEADPGTEVAVLGAVWVDAPAELYVRAISDIEQFERGASFRFTTKLDEPPALQDFDPLHLRDADVAALRRCQVGDCKIKLSQHALDRVAREVDWSRATAHADAQATMRRIAFDYVNAYREGGNASLAVYRDGDRPIVVAREFEQLVERMPALWAYLPGLRRHLLEYPRHTLPESTDFFYFQEATFGLKPTVRINHVVIAEHADGFAVASKQIYASHYFWAALELRVLVPDAARGRGFWFVNVSCSRMDGLSGFIGRLIRGKVRNESRKGMERILRNTKSRLEGQARRAAA